MLGTDVLVGTKREARKDFILVTITRAFRRIADGTVRAPSIKFTAALKVHCAKNGRRFDFIEPIFTAESVSFAVTQSLPASVSQPVILWLRVMLWPSAMT